MKPSPAVATAPNRPGNTWRRDKMQAAFLHGYFTAHWHPKRNNRTASVTHRRLQVRKLCRCLGRTLELNARLCAAETRRRDGRWRKTACSCHWLLWNAHRSKGRAANNDVSARTSRRCCSCLPSLLLIVTLSGCWGGRFLCAAHALALSGRLHVFAIWPSPPHNLHTTTRRFLNMFAEWHVMARDLRCF